MKDQVQAQVAPPVDQAKVESLLAELRSKQSLGMGLVGGFAGAIVGAIAWAAATVLTDYQIGWMAVGVGFLVGGGVRLLGRGVDNTFGYAGAALSLFGCLLGNLLCICVVIADQEQIALSVVLTHLNLAAIPELIVATFHPMDLLFYGIALYEGYRFSFRRVTEADIARVVPVAEARTGA